MLQAMEKQHGGIDALVNNASLFHPDRGDEVQDDWAQAHLQVNLMAPLALAREITLQARARSLETNDKAAHRVPCIVHVLDQKVFNLNPDYFSYTLSKLALERAVALQAQALAPFARVCGVAPGLMYLSGDQTQENFDLAARANLLRQPIDPANVARACVFLAENEGVTGTTLTVDNGQHLVPSPKDIMFVVDELLQQGRSPGPQPNPASGTPT
jgi:NAD(P)-dependent dehydrogenase (short-subunit alcohol dehydrogenase family)